MHHHRLSVSRLSLSLLSVSVFLLSVSVSVCLCLSLSVCLSDLGPRLPAAGRGPRGPPGDADRRAHEPDGESHAHRGGDVRPIRRSLPLRGRAARAGAVRRRPMHRYAPPFNTTRLYSYNNLGTVYTTAHTFMLAETPESGCTIDCI